MGRAVTERSLGAELESGAEPAKTFQSRLGPHLALTLPLFLVFEYPQ